MNATAGKIIAEIKKRAINKFPEYLIAKLSGDEDAFFPLDIPFKRLKPSAPIQELADQIETLKAWSSTQRKHGYELELKTQNSRINRHQTLPVRLFFSDPNSYLGFIGKQQEADLFLSSSNYVLKQLPELRTWILDKPLRFLKYQEKWGDLIKVLQYFKANPQPNLYPRELPIEVHTKFIETNKGILEKLLLEIGSGAIQNDDKTDAYTRLGLKKPVTWIQFRLLDPELQVTMNLSFPEMALPPESFRQLPPTPGLKVFVIENRVTFLTFPKLKNGLAIWGKGFSAASLKAPCLKAASLWYWGDMDVQGFEILALFRKNNPHVNSLLMDRQSFDQFRQFVVQGMPTKNERPANLTAEEEKLFGVLYSKNLRLEQEHLSNTWVERQLAML